MASTLDSAPVDGTFDPYNQEIIITMPDGQTQFAANIQTIFYLQNTVTYQAILYGLQVSTTLLLAVILVMMTKADKRRSIVFILNIAALVLMFIRSTIQCVQLTGPLFNYYNWAALYYPEGVEVAQRQSIAMEVLSFLVLVTIELSLMFQVRIVCCTLRRLWRYLLDIACGLMVMIAVSVRFTAMVMNIVWGIMVLDTPTETQRRRITQFASASTLTLMVSIALFSTVFCTKLGHAIYQRRKMGMKQFGPMQIIFVMGCQTLIIPLIFGILSYWVLKGVQLYTMIHTVVAIFLPLSSIWASTNTQSNVNIAAVNQWHERRGGSTAYTQGRRGTYASEKAFLPSTINTDCTLVDDRGQSVSSSSPQKSSPRDRDSIDLEMQKMGRIRVDRDAIVRSD